MNTRVIKYVVIALIASAAIVFAVESFGKSKKANKANMRNIFVGDSHAVGIGSKISGAEVDSSIAKAGWSLNTAMANVNSYPVSNDVGRVFISIGTNGAFSNSDNIDSFVSLLKQKFPNADLYVFKGSYGWGNNANVSQSQYNAYYDRFSGYGVNVLSNGLGYFTTSGAAHSTTSSNAVAIINEIKSIING